MVHGGRERPAQPGDAGEGRMKLKKKVLERLEGVKRFKA